ncbi:hypothetical protein BKA66DRAFT_573679 [Pyrenochaeta sp. MPI-SDFR-AT-0127]|nr:hypothetical protein BKA66DRAFT_573679 [Pyrenochaeta sp. MPI-SDFR-AT-0127]
MAGQRGIQEKTKTEADGGHGKEKDKGKKSTARWLGMLGAGERWGFFLNDTARAMDGAGVAEVSGQGATPTGLAGLSPMEAWIQRWEKLVTKATSLPEHLPSTCLFLTTPADPFNLLHHHLGQPGLVCPTMTESISANRDHVQRLDQLKGGISASTPPHAKVA